jgi:hypothetical protein
MEHSPLSFLPALSKFFNIYAVGCVLRRPVCSTSPSVFFVNSELLFSECSNRGRRLARIWWHRFADILTAVCQSSCRLGSYSASCPRRVPFRNGYCSRSSLAPDLDLPQLICRTQQGLPVYQSTIQPGHRCRTPLFLFDDICSRSCRTSTIIYAAYHGVFQESP